MPILLYFYYIFIVFLLYFYCVFVVFLLHFYCIFIVFFGEGVRRLEEIKNKHDLKRKIKIIIINK